MQMPPEDREAPAERHSIFLGNLKTDRQQLSLKLKNSCNYSYENPAELNLRAQGTVVKVIGLR